MCRAVPCCAVLCYAALKRQSRVLTRPCPCLDPPCRWATALPRPADNPITLSATAGECRACSHMRLLDSWRDGLRLHACLSRMRRHLFTAHRPRACTSSTPGRWRLCLQCTVSHAAASLSTSPFLAPLITPLLLPCRPFAGASCGGRVATPVCAWRPTALARAACTATCCCSRCSPLPSNGSAPPPSLARPPPHPPSAARRPPPVAAHRSPPLPAHGAQSTQQKQPFHPWQCWLRQKPSGRQPASPGLASSPDIRPRPRLAPLPPLPAGASVPAEREPDSSPPLFYSPDPASSPDVFSS